ncbi:MAG: prepilin-type N-terminal cleavage/methylation domain-containing protein [Synergistota bacterium]|nr:prepilin-type N-terminal cleavage/methylation domain-containing protein [Synergistota bacterium]
MPGSRGFTLVEVLVATALFGIIAAIAFAPSVAVVRRFEDVRLEEANEQRMEYFFRRVLREFRSSPLEVLGGAAVVLLHKDLLGGAADDRLAFWSDAYEETGVRAYKLVQLGVGWTGETGLYRWVLPRAMPEEVNWDMLDPSEGVLLLPAADFFRVELLDPEDGEWSDEYSGRRPRGIRIMVKSKEEEFPYEDWLPPM